MKRRLLIILVLAALLPAGFCLHAADPGDATAELKDLIARIKADLDQGKKTEAEQAAHLKEFDALIAKHKGETNEGAALIAFMKAGLYESIFKKPGQAVEMLQQLQLDFPNSTYAKKAEQAIAGIKEAEAAGLKEAEAARLAMAQPAPAEATLPAGSVFPDFDVKDLDGKPLSLANYKGKVVMVDFWATWCGPCVGEVPNVAKVYEKYHDKGFEIIGVSLDQSGAQDKLTNFTQEHNMPWRQYFDGKGWQNNLAVKYGIRSIPATFLLDGEGKVIAQNVRGPGLEPAVAGALGVKYDGPAPEPAPVALAVNSVFPDFQAADLDGKPLSLANYKGKVVMVDFWATWCGPCVGEVPNVAGVYEKYHNKGFDIIGISLDHPGDKDKLAAFIKENKMPWGQYYDGKDGPGKLAEKCGVQFIPFAFLVDASGKIIASGHTLRGEGLEPAVKKALGAN
jgi:thiol-disulfide isomerase/thioredoxin